jgi:hypothetical protein
MPLFNFRWFALACGLVAASGAGCAQAQTPQPQDLELARQAGFPDSTVSVLFRHGSDLRRLQDVSGRPVAGVTVAVPGSRASQAVRALQTTLGGAHVVFKSEQNFGDGPDRVAVLRSSDRYDALRTMGTNGTNYDIDTDSIITRLREWDRRYGLTLVGAGDDWVELEVGRAPSDWLALAHEIHELCPDVVDQGTETVEALAAELEKSRHIFLWWD